MNHSPLTGMLALCLFGCFAAVLAGSAGLGLVFALGGIASRGCLCRNERRSCVPRPIITYQPRAQACEPMITLQRGQSVTVPWPHELQVHLPAGVHLKIIEATPERIRVMAV